MQRYSGQCRTYEAEIDRKLSLPGAKIILQQSELQMSNKN
jgi:hypothetical protein